MRQQAAADLDEIQLDVEGLGAADASRPAAKGGVAGVAFQ